MQGPTEAQRVYCGPSPWQNTNVSLTTVLAGNPDLPFCSPSAVLVQTLHSSRAKLWRIGFASPSPPSKGLCSLCCRELHSTLCFISLVERVPSVSWWQFLQGGLKPQCYVLKYGTFHRLGLTHRDPRDLDFLGCCCGT